MKARNGVDVCRRWPLTPFVAHDLLVRTWLQNGRNEDVVSKEHTWSRACADGAVQDWRDGVSVRGLAESQAAAHVGMFSLVAAIVSFSKTKQSKETSYEAYPPALILTGLIIAGHVLITNLTADNEPNQNAPGRDPHTNFGLSASGEAIGFYDRFVREVDSVAFPAMDADESRGRCPNGETQNTVMATPTPGAENTGCP